MLPMNSRLKFNQIFLNLKYEIFLIIISQYNVKLSNNTFILIFIFLLFSID